MKTQMKTHVRTQMKTQVAAPTKIQLEKVKGIKRRYQRKIILLRIEQLILLAVIILLLCGSGRVSALTEDVSLASGRTDKRISDEISVRDGEVPENNGQAENGFLSGKSVGGRWLGESRTGTYSVPEQKALKKEEMEQDIPLLMQWDARWGYDAYGDSNIGICGCAPTCLAMVAVGLTRDERFTPAMVASYAMKRDYYMAGTGTKWALFAGFAEDYGLTCRTVGTGRSAILAELKKGNPVICSMSAGTFTLGGHFIVLCGEDNGKILVNDPNNIELSEKEWDFEEFADEIKNAWVFEKN